MHALPQPITLDGRFIRLVPLTLDHHAPLCEVGLDPELWRWTVADVRTPEQLRGYLETALRAQAEGNSLPFVIVEKAREKIIGSTRFGNIEPAHKRLEIGWTWVGRAWQRSGVNTEAKLLLLTHAFEKLGFNRVEFKTDVLNEKSRAALRRIGAVEEGVLRSHIITESGRNRDTVYFSIIKEEWPAVKRGLEEKLAR